MVTRECDLLPRRLRCRVYKVTTCPTVQGDDRPIQIVPCGEAEVCHPNMQVLDLKNSMTARCPILRVDTPGGRLPIGRVWIYSRRLILR